MWPRCLPEGTVWEPFLSDDRGELRRDDHGKLLPGPRRTAVLGGVASQLVSILRAVLIWAGILHDPRWSAAAVAPVHCLCRGCGAPTRADVSEERNESHGCAAEDRAVASLARRTCWLPQSTAERAPQAGHIQLLSSALAFCAAVQLVPVAEQAALKIDVFRGILQGHSRWITHSAFQSSYRRARRN